MPSILFSTSPNSPAVSKRRGSNGSGVRTIDRKARNAGQFGMGGLDDVFGSDEEAVVDSARGALSSILEPPTGIPLFGPDGISCWTRASLRDGFYSLVTRWIYRTGTVRI
jgi:hypothetical protein